MVSLMTSNQSTGRRRRRRKPRVHSAVILAVVIFVAVWIVFAMVIILGPSSSQQEGGGPELSVARLYIGRLRGRTPNEPLPQFQNEFPPPYPKVTRTSFVDGDVVEMCDRTLWHTLETTTIVLPNQETFIHTGDIDDLWLRDSAAQIHPLLVKFHNNESLVEQDPKLERVVAGLIKRSAWYIRHDPYANAFRIDDTYVFSQEQKQMGRHDYISTWNYELDSACYFMRMLYFFYQSVPTHAVLRETRVREAVEIMVDLWIAEQHHEDDAFPEGPLFDCQNCGKPYRYPTVGRNPGLPRNGKGTPVAYTGMTWSGFRPSDDACQYGYLIPSNMFAVVVLRYIQELAPILWPDSSTQLVQKAKKLANEIDSGIQQHGIVQHEKHGKIYAYEVDGLGKSLLMDDANVPSLLSIPYLGYDFDPTIYANTRRFVLSSDNPTYQEGTNPLTGDIAGYGSPHMNAAIRNNIWPMALAVQGLTSSSQEEKVDLAKKLAQATGGTGWMHESFDVSNPKRFTRSWFCWADSLFAELVMSLTDKCPSDNNNKSTYKILSWRDPEQVPGGPHAVERRST